ncbi:MAG TPA: exodeoxyribonuclease VII small subunit [Gammaproteobacteria bacterium]|nr:exodeoxyribonuclease VII small subunit [Gammaproteobacteria bacterium]
MANEQAEPFDFEASLKELEDLVTRLERGDMSLEDSLKSFERGVALTRSCQKALEEAEQKVEILLQRDDKAAPQPFDGGEDNGGDA